MENNVIKMKKMGIKTKEFFNRYLTLIDAKLFNLMGSIYNKWEKMNFKRQLRILRIIQKTLLFSMLVIIVVLTPSEIISVFSLPDGSGVLKPYLNLGTSISLIVLGFVFLFLSFYLLHFLNRIIIQGEK